MTTQPLPHSPALPTENNSLLGVTLIAFSTITAIAFVVLSSVFEFPDVLRASGSEVLPLFAEQSAVVRFTYWVLAMTGLVLIGAAVELGRLLSPFAPGPARLASGFGVATGVFWSLGYARWPITMPYLSDMYEAGDEERAVELYGLLNSYAGMTVGEHLGFITMGLFAIALATALRRAAIQPTWLYPVGIVAGVSIAVTSYEQYDNDVVLLGELNGAANTIWFLWLLALGVSLVRRRPATNVRAPEADESYRSEASSESPRSNRP